MFKQGQGIAQVIEPLSAPQPDTVSQLQVLAASIAHEVSQPLFGILTNASTCLRMLSADPPNVDGARETALRTTRDVKRAADMISRLRALYAKHEANVESVDLNDVVRSALALSRHELDRTRVAVRCELADDLPALLGDRIQLEQVVFNLVRNAMDAMKGLPAGPRELTITTARQPERDQAILSVRDVGTGFAPHDAAKLFQPFFTTKSEGMGIGLSISRSIAERHGGQLWATPNRGPGATFWLSIPCPPQERTQHSWIAADFAAAGSTSPSAVRHREFTANCASPSAAI